MCRLPISVLEHNIVGEFEDVLLKNKRDLKSPVRDGRLHAEIDLILDKIRPRSPNANMMTRKISLYESHLAFIWSYIYSSFVIYEVGVQQKMVDDTFSGEIKWDDKLIRRAKRLQDWAILFSTQYAKWDDISLPNPKTTPDKNERSYVLNANGIYLRAVIYLLLHEYAHLVQRHDKNDDKAWQLDQEKEADNFAMSFLVDDSSTEIERKVAGVSVVLLHTSLFFLPGNLRGIWQQTHPHLHDRLRNCIIGLNLETEESKFYIYYLAATSLQMYLESQGVDCPQIECETAEDLFYDYLERIDELRTS